MTDIRDIMHDPEAISYFSDIPVKELEKWVNSYKSQKERGVI